MTPPIKQIAQDQTKVIANSLQLDTFKNTIPIVELSIEILYIYRIEHNISQKEELLSFGKTTLNSLMLSSKNRYLSRTVAFIKEHKQAKYLRGEHIGLLTFN